MRQIVLAMFMSLDGYIDGPNKEFFGPPYSPDLQRLWIDRNMQRAGMMMYGRTMYEGMVKFWTSPAAHPQQAAALAETEKIVFSTTLVHADWGRVRVFGGDIAAEMGRLKAEPGGDMVLIGGAGIATSFLRLGLIDEMTLLVCPFLSGGGTRLFQDGYARTPLTLAASEPLDNGCVLLTYRRE